MLTRKIRQRFWAKVKRGNGCWLWTGAMCRTTGYGSFKLPGIGMRGAHRIAWMLRHGQVPTGKCVLHRCDNRRCVRPGHLWVGTKKDNSMDMAKKGRQVFQRHPARVNPHGMWGEDAPHVKLTMKQVLTIRCLLTCQTPITKLAKRFNVTYQCIQAIRKRATWAHLD